MPFTYFAHQTFVLPFKVARPRWFDGTALLVAARRVSLWNGDAGPARRREPERWFWPFVAAGSLLSLPAASSVLVTGGGAPAAIMRASWVLLGVLVVATLRARRPPEVC